MFEEEKVNLLDYCELSKAINYVFNYVINLSIYVLNSEFTT